jgi:hypothetical protein
MSEQFPNLTPYQAFQVTEARLTEMGDERKITPQAMYSLAKNGTVASNHAEFVKAGGKGNPSGIKVEFNGEAFKTWLDAYLNGTGGTGRKSTLPSLIKAFSAEVDEVDEDETADEPVATPAA